MYVESISRLTASEESGPFMRLRPENVNEVFQSLVKMGDVAHALGDDSIPMPTVTLTAQTYAETMLTHLRPPYRDVENFAESVDNYDLDDEDFQTASPWLDVEALENIRVSLEQLEFASQTRFYERGQSEAALTQALEETGDAIRVLREVQLHPAAVAELNASRKQTQRALHRRLGRDRALREAMLRLRAARALLIDESAGAGRTTRAR